MNSKEYLEHHAGLLAEKQLRREDQKEDDAFQAWYDSDNQKFPLQELVVILCINADMVDHYMLNNYHLQFFWGL